MQIGENVLWLLVLIGVMITVHELGHFWAARFFDVKVEAFSFGFGPRLFGFKRGETDYRFSLILLGGYVKMAGEQFSEDQNVEDPRSLLAKPRWQRLIIAFAGPAMNVVLAVGLLTGLFMVKFQKVADEDLQVVIGHVTVDSPAAKAGIQDNDRIVRLDGKKNPTWEDVFDKVITSASRPIRLTIERKGKYFDTTLTPALNERVGGGFAGWDGRGQVYLAKIEPGQPAEKAGLKEGDVLVTVNGQQIHSTTQFQEITRNSNGKPIEVEFNRQGQNQVVTIQPVYRTVGGESHWMIGVGPQPKVHIVNTRLSPPDAFRESLAWNRRNATVMYRVIEGMLERRLSTKNLSGPIGIATMAGEAARMGAYEFFLMMAMVSLQLAIFNLLPIPILDGGQIAMLLVEMTMQRDLSLNVKELVFKVGFVCIMLIVAFALYNDISRYFPAG
ncbi:MAG TPA: RIP metalloprotease RseP [Candidatus Solibacter sp.]|nr:RIP metalloprotease RseP [Candidatus Solibacter sp.]